jgi:glycosyltransferase involved in cell wall biosynthesis
VPVDKTDRQNCCAITNMRILLIITDYGSFNNFLSELAVKLVKGGREVHVICSAKRVINLKNKYPYTELGIIFHYVDFPRSFNILQQVSASRAINKKIDEIDPYLINVHFTSGIFTTLLWRKPPYFTIGTIHGVGYPMIRSKVRRMIFQAVEWFCFKKLDQIYLINAFDYNLVKKLHPYKTFRYKSFGVGYDFKKFDPFQMGDDFKMRLRAKMGIQKDDFVLVFTGRFVAFKGFDIVIRTMLLLSEHNHTVKLILIGGEDPAHSTGLLPEEEFFFKNDPGIKHVGFTPDVNQYLAISDLFVFPSQKEGMPVCIMEALAMGLPVLTSDSRGCNDLVKNNFNGVLLSSSPTTAETHAAILNLLENRDTLKMFSDNAISERNLYSREKFIKNQIEIYDRIKTEIEYQNAS